jgi:D-alanyl-D-alanine carboxypeptidase/D-alanyl-D-alanine-endopeptidase (penicillin-binding protein 4)
MGAYIRPVNGGQPLLTAYADTPRNPASTMKLVTTYSALGVLGPDYRWPTEIYTAGNLAGDTLQGDVIIKGYGNPDFREGDFRQLLQALRARGIRNIAGNFIIDKTYFNVPNQGSIDGKDGASYNALPEALLYNERGSCYEVRGKAGQIQRICPIAPRNSNELNVNLFGDFWRIWVGEMGGHLAGGLRIAGLPGGAQLVHTHHSTPLRNVIAEINKDSNNVMARQLLLSMGAKQHGAPGTTQKGASAVGQFLESRGLRFSNLRIDNGSGLSRSERISAREMGEMLVDIYNSPYRHELMSSMAVLGVDGTVKNRMKNLTGRGKFKTGTLRDVRALAGYLTAANGQPYVISILHNDANIRASAKAAHDDLVEWVYYGGQNNVASAR